MRGAQRDRGRRLAATLAVAVLAVACSSQPQSQARESAISSTAPESTAPASAPPPTEPPSEAPATPAITPEPGGPAEPPAATAPDKPAQVTWKRVGSEDLGNDTQRVTHRITWTAPDGVATKFTVVGVTECLRESKALDGKACLVKGMRIPKRVQEVVATAAGSARTIDIAWKEGELGGGPYRAILIRASNAAGNSTFAIAWSDVVCWKCTF